MIFRDKLEPGVQCNYMVEERGYRPHDRCGTGSPILLAKADGVQFLRNSPHECLVHLMF